MHEAWSANSKQSSKAAIRLKITSFAWCKSQQNVLTTEIKIKTSN